jgi:uncharacterized protein YkwD
LTAQLVWGVERMNARTAVTAAFLAAGILAPAAQPDVTGPVPPVPPLPQPLGGLLSPSSSSGQTTQTAHGQTTQTSQAANAKSKSSITAVPAFARSIVAAINQTRVHYGLRSLRESRPLTKAAIAHATVLATSGTFTHLWSDGRAFPTWIRTYYSDRGYRTWTAAENLLWSSPGIDGQTVVARWLGSPTHRHILLTSSWREVGLGVVEAAAAPGAYGGSDVDVVAAEFGTRSK